MTSSTTKATLIFWEIKNFHNQWHSNKDRDMLSDRFNSGSSHFKLFFKTDHSDWRKNSFGIVLKSLADKKSMEVKLKLWLENEEKQKFYEHSVEEHLFKKAEDQCKLNLNVTGNDWDLLSDVYDNKKSLYVCCELIDLNEQATVPIVDFSQMFLQNIWSMYEKEKQHDAIIKVGKKQFKVSMVLLAAQSEVFDHTFSSAPKEGHFCIAEVKDVSEKTMEQLIKWIYSCQVEDKSTVEDLYEAADKYKINLLKITCAELMINRLDDSNALRRLILAIDHDDKQLKNSVLDYVGNMLKSKISAYLLSPEWNEFVSKKPAIMNEVSQLLVEKMK